MEVLLNEQTWFKGKKKNLEHEIGAALPPLYHPVNNRQLYKVHFQELPLQTEQRQCPELCPARPCRRLCRGAHWWCFLSPPNCSLYGGVSWVLGPVPDPRASPVALCGGPALKRHCGVFAGSRGTSYNFWSDFKCLGSVYKSGL